MMKRIDTQDELEFNDVFLVRLDIIDIYFFSSQKKIIELAVDAIGSMPGVMDNIDCRNCSLSFVSAIVVTDSMAPCSASGADTSKLKGSPEVGTLELFDPLGNGRSSIRRSSCCFCYSSITENIFVPIFKNIWQRLHL